MRHEQGQRSAPSSGSIGPGWEAGAQAVFLGLRDWRALHPTATLAEIEQEIDRQLAHLRAQVVADVALASAATAVGSDPPAACPDCGGRLRDEGPQERTMQTVGHAPVILRRDYATCVQCGRRLFPPRS